MTLTASAARLDEGIPEVEERRRRLARRASILDGLRDEVRALRCEVGSDGATKLDAYLDSIRTIEGRIDSALRDPVEGSNIPEVVVDRAYDDSGIWSDSRRFPELGQLQMEILVAALAADSTRVASLSWGASVSRVRYRWLSINYPDREKHQLSHPHVDEYGLDIPRARSDNGEIFRWHEEQLATFIEMLKAVPEGDETLFHHTLILRCSEMGFGNHGRSNIPFLLAGSAGGAFRTGRYFDLAGSRGDAFRRGGYSLGGEREGYERTHNDLLTAVAQGFGLDLAEIGRPEDNTGAYTEILS